MDGHEWLAGYRQRLDEIEERAAGARRELAGVRGTATSPDGAVTVTVDPAGSLLGLVLAERSEDMSRAQLAALVLATVRRAHADAAREARSVVRPLFGPDLARALDAHLAAADADR